MVFFWRPCHFQKRSIQAHDRVHTHHKCTTAVVFYQQVFYQQVFPYTQHRHPLF